MRAALTVLLACLIENWWRTPGGVWLPISAAVVMCTEPRMGGLLQRSYARLTGTLLGTGVALGAQVALGTAPWATNTVTCLAVALFAYLATGSPYQAQIGTLGAISTLIVLVDPASSLETAGNRVLAVVLGVVLALVVSRYAWPDRAEVSLIASIRRSLAQLARCFEEGVAPCNNDPEYGGIVMALVTEEQKLMAEARLESGDFDASRYGRVLRIQRRLFRFLQLLVVSSRDLEMGPELQAFHRATVETLDKMAHGEAGDTSRLAELHAALNPSEKPQSVAFVYTARLFLDELSALNELLDAPTKAPASPPPPG